MDSLMCRARTVNDQWMLEKRRIRDEDAASATGPILVETWRPGDAAVRSRPALGNLLLRERLEEVLQIFECLLAVERPLALDLSVAGYQVTTQEPERLLNRTVAEVAAR